MAHQGRIVDDAEGYLYKLKWIRSFSNGIYALLYHLTAIEAPVGIAETARNRSAAERRLSAQGGTVRRSQKHSRSPCRIRSLRPRPALFFDFALDRQGGIMTGTLALFEAPSIRSWK